MQTMLPLMDDGIVSRCDANIFIPLRDNINVEMVDIAVLTPRMVLAIYITLNEIFAVFYNTGNKMLRLIIFTFILAHFVHNRSLHLYPGKTVLYKIIYTCILYTVYSRRMTISKYK